MGAWELLLGLAATAGGADVIEGDGAATEEDKGKGEGGQSEGKFISAVSDHAVVEVHFGDGYGEVDAEGEGGDTRKQARQHQQATHELGEGGDVGGPGGESEAGDEVGMVMESTEYLVVSVGEHDGSKSDAHDQERKGLQTIEVTQLALRRKKKDRLQQRQ